MHHDPADPVASERPEGAHGPAARRRLTDRQALIVIGAYFAARQVTTRVGLVGLPWLLKNAVWAIPLLNAQLLPVITAASSDDARGSPGLLVAIGSGAMLIAVVAGWMLYWTGLRFGPKLAELGAKPGSMWGSLWNPKQIARAERLIDRYGVATIALSRATGRLVTPVCLVAGSANMATRRFLAIYVPAAAAWTALLVWLGVKIGDTWPWLDDRIESFASASARIGLIALGALLVVALISFFRSESGAAAPDETT